MEVYVNKKEYTSSFSIVYLRNSVYICTNI